MDAWTVCGDCHPDGEVVVQSLPSERSGGTPLALDLGTSRTQVFAPVEGLRIDEPTVLAWDSSGHAFAAGRRAWEVSVSTGARLSLICDVGAGVLELGAVADGRLLAQSSATVGTSEYLDHPERLVLLATWVLQRLLEKVSTTIARHLVAGPVHLVGGGALLPGLEAGLADGFQMETIVHDQPRQAVINGLTRFLPRGVDMVGRTKGFHEPEDQGRTDLSSHPALTT